MGQELLESREEGLTRIEITFTAGDQEGEDEILHPIFHERAQIELDRAERALSSVPGLCWHIPQLELLTKFTEIARRS